MRMKLSQARAKADRADRLRAVNLDRQRQLRELREGKQPTAAEPAPEPTAEPTVESGPESVAKKAAKKTAE